MTSCCVYVQNQNCMDTDCLNPFAVVIARTKDYILYVYAGTRLSQSRKSCLIQASHRIK